MFKTHRKANRHSGGLEGVEPNGNINSMMLNDISPIAHAIDGSQFTNTAFTNILDSGKDGRRVGMSGNGTDKTEDRRENNE